MSDSLIRHGFLITAYRDFESLKNLISQLLEIDQSKIYCHIDQRSSSLINEILTWLDTSILSNSRFKNRVHIQMNKTIHWGSSTHLNIQLELCKLGLDDDCDYFHTLTGQCRLVVTQDKFEAFFKKNRDVSFIETFELPTPNWPGQGGLERIKFYQLYDLLDAKKPGKLFKRLNKHIIQIQRVLRFNRLRKLSIEPNRFYGGSSYWSINKKAAEYLLKHQSVNTYSYKHSFCAEEIIPHSILMNNKNLSNLIINQNLRFIDWEECNGETPAILDERHLNLIKSPKDQNTQYIFARKFDSRYSQKLIYLIEKDA